MTKYENNIENHIYSKMGKGWFKKNKKQKSAAPGARALIVNSDDLQFPFFFCSGPKPLLIWLSERPDGKKGLHRERKYEQGSRAHHCFCTGCKSSHIRITATRQLLFGSLKKKRIRDVNRPVCQGANKRKKWQPALC